MSQFVHFPCSIHHKPCVAFPNGALILTTMGASWPAHRSSRGVRGAMTGTARFRSQTGPCGLSPDTDSGHSELQSGVCNEAENSTWRTRVSGPSQEFAEQCLQRGAAAAEITRDRNQKAESAEKAERAKSRLHEIKQDDVLLIVRPALPAGRIGERARAPAAGLCGSQQLSHRRQRGRG